jgi:aryl-alcohol dehydrogenase-like predicted oxidoreductase
MQTGLAPIAAKYDMTGPQMVLVATLMHPGIHCAITGAKRPEQIEETAAAMGC